MLGVALLACSLAGAAETPAKDVIERARELAQRLEPSADPARLGMLRRELEEVAKRAEALGTATQEERRAVEADARSIARRIAFANPLLAGIDRLVFIKRHPAEGEFHMCDQYYGFNAVPGGGLFVLEKPFSEKPQLRNLLENSIVEHGRMRGKKLEGGAFLSPAVSYDGKTILFAYSEAQGKNLEWSPQASYHIFRVNADGTGLVQLTDGRPPWARLRLAGDHRPAAAR